VLLENGECAGGVPVGKRKINPKFWTKANQERFCCKLSNYLQEILQKNTTGRTLPGKNPKRQFICGN
jgi:hypothetical protein